MGWKHRKFAGVLASQYDLKTAQRLTLDVIADHIMEMKGDSVSLSNANLAHKVGCSPMTIIRHLKSLEVVTELVQSKVAGSTSHYTMHLPEGFEPEEFNTYQADVHNPQSSGQKLSNFAEMARDAIQATEHPTDEETYGGSVPGVDDWRECKRIHLALLEDPQYGDSPAQRIKNAIILGKHPAWAGTGEGIEKELPYDKELRQDGLETPADRHKMDPGAAKPSGFENGYNPNNPGSVK